MLASVSHVYQVTKKPTLTLYASINMYVIDLREGNIQLEYVMTAIQIKVAFGTH